MTETNLIKLLTFCVTDLGVKGVQLKGTKKTDPTERITEIINKLRERTSGDSLLIEFKYNFGGSGQKGWKSSVTKDPISGKKTLDPLKTGSEPVSGPVPKVEKTKFGGTDYDVKIEVEYAGPMGIIARLPKLSKKGLKDTGATSTDKVVMDALADIQTKIDALDRLADTENDDTLRITNENKASLLIKGFSRGGAAATAFAYMFGRTSYAARCNITIALFDPVHGGGPDGSLGSSYGKMPDKIDLGSTTAIINSIRILPVSAGDKGLEKANRGFTPQAVSGVGKLCIVYGKGAGHDSGQFGEFSYNGNRLKGNGWNDLPDGLWAVESTRKAKKEASDLSSKYGLTGDLALSDYDLLHIDQDFRDDPIPVEEIDTDRKLLGLFKKIFKIKSKVKIVTLRGKRIRLPRVYYMGVKKVTKEQNRHIEVVRACADLMKNTALCHFLDSFLYWTNNLKSGASQIPPPEYENEEIEQLIFQREELIDEEDHEAYEIEIPPPPPPLTNLWADEVSSFTNAYNSLSSGGTPEEAKNAADYGGREVDENNQVGNVNIADVELLLRMMNAANDAATSNMLDTFPTNDDENYPFFVRSVAVAAGASPNQMDVFMGVISGEELFDGIRKAGSV